MGTYVYTCRKATLDIAGITIGHFAFAYKVGRDGWTPDGWGSNKYVLSLETKAKQARAARAGEYGLYIQGGKTLNKKSVVAMLKYGRLPVYSVHRSTYQVIEEFNQKPFGYLQFAADNKTVEFVAVTELGYAA